MVWNEIFIFDDNVLNDGRKLKMLIHFFIPRHFHCYNLRTGHPGFDRIVVLLIYERCSGSVISSNVYNQQNQSEALWLKQYEENIGFPTNTACYAVCTSKDHLLLLGQTREVGY